VLGTGWMGWRNFSSRWAGPHQAPPFSVHGPNQREMPTTTTREAERSLSSNPASTFAAGGVNLDAGRQAPLFARCSG
jgi:hypothetical protein